MVPDFTCNFTKGQIKLKAVWWRRRFFQKANKTNLFVCFLGESKARQSAFDFI